MNITDKYVLKQLKIANSDALYGNLEEFPESERDGKSDLQILMDELEYLIDLYNSEGTTSGGELDEAREILQMTKNGKEIPMLVANDGYMQPRFDKWKIEESKAIVNEYRRLCNLDKRLKAKRMSQ